MAVDSSDGSCGGPSRLTPSALILAFALLTVPLAAEEQPMGKVYRIGYLRAERPPAVDVEAFRPGLREHGYVEGKNVVVEYRWADGSEERLRSILAELIRLKVDLIVTSAPAATRAAKEAFDAAVKSRAGGLITLEDPFTIAHHARISILRSGTGWPRFMACGRFRMPVA
jgi:hypothetical protein